MFRRFIFLSVVILGCACCASAPENAVIPRPQSLKEYPGHFRIHGPLSLSFRMPAPGAEALAAYLQTTPIPCVEDPSGAAKNYLRFELADDESLPDSEEGYLLSVRPAGITVRSRGEAGLFYGLQTLLQLQEQYGMRLPALEIADAPRFPYRGMHLDVSRHFFDKEFVKKQLRMMASLKLNRLHWHLVDGAGWRLEIDSYPQLTRMAAWRCGDTWQQWQDGGCRYANCGDPGAYGGFYTKEDVRDVLACADSLHITVIPEIEMPGHSDEVLAAYPELACTGPVRSGDLCIGNEQTFEFLEHVLTEVMELFPSEYIHIGGDEASKSAWAVCPRCRARMEREHLAGVDELQSYAVHRVEAFLNRHGRRLVGWDEILDGGVAPNAVIMSWRGETGGRIAAAAGHDVIMTPNGYCYLDTYQDNPAEQPRGMSGYLPLSKVYSFDPAPEGIPGREHILGAQANLWTERIPTPEHAEYMLYPRMFALAEVVWSDPEGRSYEEFRPRALLRVRKAVEKGYAPFDLSKEYGERRESLEPVEHLAVGCPVAYATPWHEKYASAGAGTLTDGERGSWSYTARWQGFLDSDVDVTVDLGAVRPIRSVTADFLQCSSAWVWMPERVEIEVSDDGERFRPLSEIANTLSPDELRLTILPFGWSGSDQARYIRYHAVSGGREGGWLFTDEIIVK